MAPNATPQLVRQIVTAHAVALLGGLPPAAANR